MIMMVTMEMEIILLTMMMIETVTLAVDKLPIQDQAVKAVGILHF